MTKFPERGDEFLARIAAEAALQDPSSRAYEYDRFTHWLVRDAARQQSDTERDAAEQAATTFAAAMSARVTASRMTKKYPRYRLRERSADVPGTFEQTAALALQERCAPRVDLRVAAGVGRELWDEVCDGWVELPPELPRGQYVALTVAGDSMIPLLHDGDVILVNPRAKLTRDSVIVARRPEDGYVVKYVAQLGRREIELASLNPAYAPFTLARDPALIVGTVIARLGHDESTKRPLP